MSSLNPLIACQITQDLRTRVLRVFLKGTGPAFRFRFFISDTELGSCVQLAWLWLEPLMATCMPTLHVIHCKWASIKPTPQLSLPWCALTVFLKTHELAHLRISTHTTNTHDKHTRQTRTTSAHDKTHSTNTHIQTHQLCNPHD